MTLKLPPPPPPTVRKPPGVPTNSQKGFKLGHSVTALITDPQDLIDCYEAYEADANEKKDPISLYVFIGFAQRRLGITNRWWGKQSRGDLHACKIPGLREAITAIESRVVGDLSLAGLRGSVHPGMAAQELKIIADRDVLAAEREWRQATEELKDAAVPPEQRADIVHPDCTHQQLAAIQAAGLKPILYTQQQLEAGMPHILPPGFSDD